MVASDDQWQCAANCSADQNRATDKGVEEWCSTSQIQSYKGATPKHLRRQALATWQGKQVPHGEASGPKKCDANLQEQLRALQEGEIYILALATPLLGNRGGGGVSCWHPGGCRC